MTDEEQLRILSECFHAQSTDLNRFLDEMETFGLSIQRFAKELARYGASVRIFADTIREHRLRAGDEP